ncbi:helix-turn-helix domain-containing protein [Escherichia coli]|nr:helix-turn-helix domain-containing protein [Escherichia coli]HBB3510035.1 helix-turn-helix domain-containing protein [Escherichia coli]
MDKTATILINREQVQKMLGGLSKSSYFKLVRKWKDAGTPFPDPVEGMPALKHGGFLYRYQDVMKFFKSIGLLSDSDNQ